MTSVVTSAQGFTCSYCLGEVGDDAPVCPVCAAPAHDECWTENAGCPVFGCSAAPVESSQPGVSLGMANAAPPQVNPMQADHREYLAPTASFAPPPPTPVPALPPSPLVAPQAPWAGFSTNGYALAGSHNSSTTRRVELPRGNAAKALALVALVVLGIAGGSIATRQNLLPGGPVYDRSQLTSKVTSARADGYEAGHSSGYDDGYSAGKSAGYDDGYSTGKSAGYDDGYSVGKDAGSSDATAQHDQGYADGYSAGYDAGVSCGASNTTDAYLYCTANAP